MSEETKKRLKLNRNRPLLKQKRPRQNPISRKLNPLQKRPKRKTGSAKNPKSWKP